MNTSTSSALELITAYGGDFLIPRNDVCIGSLLKESGQFETSDIQRALGFIENATKHASKKKIFIDIGANIGTHSVSALKERNYCTAIAIEPSESNYRILTANLCLNGLMERVTCVQAAASNCEDVKTLFVNPKNCGDYRLDNNPHGNNTDESPITEKVITIDIGQYLLDNIDHIQPEDTLCWIDTQGHEISILSSLRPLLKRGMPAVFEYWPYGLEQQSGCFEKLESALSGLDLSYAVLTKEDIQPISLNMLKALWGKLRAADTGLPDGARFGNIIIYRSVTEETITPYEQARIIMTAKCNDSDHIPKVENAGQVFIQENTPCQLMHNGLKVVPGGYYGAWMSKLIKILKGHHEPQEEKVFNEIVKRASSSGLMIELGCFWAYYSLWFLKENQDRIAIGLEPDPTHLDIAIQNTKLNKLSDQIRIINGLAASTSSDAISLRTESGIAVTLRGYTIKDLLYTSHKSKIEILHCDAQGAEHFIIDQVIELGIDHRLRFCVISTHAYEITGDPLTHQKCLEKLQAAGAHIIAEHDVHESFSGDGLIAASFSPEDKELAINLTCNRYSQSLFPSPAVHLSNVLNDQTELLRHLDSKDKESKREKGILRNRIAERLKRGWQ